MLRSVPDLLKDVLKYSERCRQFASGKSYLAYANDDAFRFATERCVGIVGEALWQTLKQEPAVLQAVPDARKIIALRHRLIHDYNSIYDAIIWAVVQQRLESLEWEIRAFLREVEGEQASDE